MSYETDEQKEGRQKMNEYVRGAEPFFLTSGEDPIDPAESQPMNIPALILHHLDADSEKGEGPMRTLTMRLTQHSHDSLEDLAEILGTPKTTFARELMEMAIREAFASLPEDLQEQARERWLDRSRARKGDA